MASLLYTYRKYLGKPSRQQKNNGQLYAFDMDGFIKSLPYDRQEYTTMLRDTQGESSPNRDFNVLGVGWLTGITQDSTSSFITAR